MRSRCWIALGVLAAFAGSATAVVHDRAELSPLAEKEFMAPELEAIPVNARIDDLPHGLAGSSLDELERLGVAPDAGLLDTRGGRWRTLMPAFPLIPGKGVGNFLTWDAFGAEDTLDDDAIGTIAWEQVRAYVNRNADSLRIDPSELVHRVAVHDGGELVQIWADRVSGGLPVRGAGFTAVINNGNLVLMGAESWGDVRVERIPSISAERASERVARFIAPLDVEALREEPTLAILPTRVDEKFDVGRGYGHRLAWIVRADVAGDIGQWEALVDAHNGEVLALQDLNHYSHERRVMGGVYPTSDDGIPGDGNMIGRWPMPFANLSPGGFTDAGGNFINPGGAVTTTLSGQYVGITDFCGAISETSTGDIDLAGANGDTDCVVPPGHSAGDTAAARVTFYHAGRTNEVGRGQLPANAWLSGQLPAHTNVSPFCNAFWTGSTIRFFREAAPCANTGQIAAVVNHEWGHGMDDNDVNGSIPSSTQGGGEGMADLYAALRQNHPCVGRGFWANGMLCGGYGDPCTAASGCTGIRSVDFRDRTSGVPHTLTWVRANCGFTVHCLGAAYAEAVWDLFKRDLPSGYGMDNNTAMEVVTRLTFIGAGNASGWFDRTGPPPGGAACGATQAYLQYMAADDDDGNITNGTPHMKGIAVAFGRHEIDCTPAFGGPAIIDAGCPNNPTTTTGVKLIETTTGADLFWGSVPGAASYNVYRTDGVWKCDFGKALVGSTSGKSFSDSGLQKQRDYFYTVIPMGAGGASCFGPASPCTGRRGKAYVMSPPYPGTVGTTNTFTASNGTPGQTNTFVFGFNSGSSPLPGCTTSLGISPYYVLGSAVAGADGVAEFNLFIPGSASGLSLLLQSVELSTCKVSNVIKYQFP